MERLQSGKNISFYHLHAQSHEVSPFVSDVRGYLETVYLGYYSYIHEGIVSFLDYLVQRHGYHVIFLTSRPITHKAETR